jgi:hypothetical protein
VQPLAVGEEDSGRYRPSRRARSVGLRTPARHGTPLAIRADVELVELADERFVAGRRIEA